VSRGPWWRTLTLAAPVSGLDWLALGSPRRAHPIAEGFHRLMTETLGYDRYFAFGGDIGGAASGWLATMHPAEVAGLHVIHGPFPADFDAHPVTPAEQAFFDAEEARDEWDSGYSDIMSTRPDTIAAALADSPAGLAAWIVDKYRAWSDCDGDLESRWDRDTLCTVLTLYWATESIGTSFRQYLDYPANGPRPTITVPVAVTQSHEADMDAFPRSIAERAASDIRQYSTPHRGGHFLPFEAPDLIATELTSFMAAVSAGPASTARPVSS
jgi:pimeloyl-ACP methyl ester carboxylesterase